MPATRDYHPQLRVTQAEQFAYDGRASQLLDHALAQYSKFNGIIDTDDWRLVRKRRQMSVFKSKMSGPNPSVTLMTGSGLIQGSLEDVMDGLYCDNTADLRAVKTLLHYKLVNGAVLNVNERRSAAAPFRFAGIKWVAAKASWGLAKNRDLLTYERMGTVRDENGLEFAFHVLQSIDHPEWPTDATKGVKRAATSTCYLYQRLPNNRVEVFLWGEVSDIGSRSQRLAEYVVAGTWLNVVYSVDCAEAKRRSKLMARTIGQSWPIKKTCHLCNKRPGIFETARQCAGCTQRMCKSCSCSRETFQIDQRTGKPIEERFCKTCANKAAAATVTRAQDRRDRFASEPIRGNTRVPVTRLRSRSADSQSDLGSTKSEKLSLNDSANRGRESLPNKTIAGVIELDDNPWTTSKLNNFDLGIISGAEGATVGSGHPTPTNGIAARKTRHSSMHERLSERESSATRWQCRIELGLLEY